MPPSSALLLDKILSYKERSPLITVLDDCSQSARPLLREFLQRATKSQRKVVYVTFEDTLQPLWVRKTLETQTVRGLMTLEERLAQRIPGSSTGLRPMSAILKDVQNIVSSKPQNTVVIIDCITPVFLEPSMDPIQFLGSLLSFQTYSVVLSHHTDITLPSSFPHYPSPQPLLSHISTTVLTVSSFDHHKLRMEAESQALPDPIEQDRAIDGVISTLGSNASQRMIISVEYRKKSGRTILENFTLDINTGKIDTLNVPVEKSSQEGMSLDFGTTFNLGMTQRQKETKEEIVLPHFSAQALSGDDNREGGVGHIEYTLDAEDDFDDEEDVDEDLLV